MKPSLIVVLVMLLAAGNSYAQSACSLPEARGLAVGMKTDEITRRFPMFAMPKADRYGYAEIRKDFSLEYGRYESYSSDSAYKPPPNPFEGLDTSNLAALDVAFLDGRIVTLVFSYKRSVEWRGIQEFIQALAPALKLPDATEWAKVDGSTRELTCQNGKIQATVNSKKGGSSLTIGEVGITEEIRKRKQARKDRERKTFKPAMFRS